VLSAFSLLSGVEVDLEGLSRDADTVDHAILELMEKLQQKTGDEGDGEPTDADEETTPPTNGKGMPELDAASRKRIEEMFEAALRDRKQAMYLKEELDRLGVFKLYENRFLDLFRHAE